MRRRRGRPYPRSVIPPLPQDMPPPRPGRRAPIPATATAAAYAAHLVDSHHGHAEPGCRTCRNYVAAITAGPLP